MEGGKDGCECHHPAASWRLTRSRASISTLWWQILRARRVWKGSAGEPGRLQPPATRVCRCIGGRSGLFRGLALLPLAAPLGDSLHVRCILKQAELRAASSGKPCSRVEGQRR